MRKSFNMTWLMVAKTIGNARSTCVRRKIGCVITDKDNQIVSTGYNGAASKQPHCINEDVGCLRNELNIKSGTKLETCRAIHAEANALIQAGQRAREGNLYVNCVPCPMCARMIANSGVSKVFYSGMYSRSDGLDILKQAGIKMFRYMRLKGAKHEDLYSRSTKLSKNNNS